MTQSHLQAKNKVHFIGVGGIGMSGLAELILRLGHPVSGSDLSESENVRRLQELGAEIWIGHEGSRLAESSLKPDLVVVSSAVHLKNPEWQEALKMGVKVIPRAEMLSQLMRLKEGIAVGGTHGKTTTTSLVGTVLTDGGLDPTLVVGGIYKAFGTNTRLGAGKYLVAEADESDGSFLRLAPRIAVVTNIDDDHLDHFGNLDNLHQAFMDFIEKVPFYGRAFLCQDDPVLSNWIPKIQAPLTTYGLSSYAHLRAVDLKSHSQGVTFGVVLEGHSLGEVQIPLSGSHNVQNALAAVGVGLELGIPFETIQSSLQNFQGVGRRFEIKGEVDGITVVDDYAHHPTEISVTIQAAKERWPDRRLVICFQPHRFSRTRDCFDRFGPALKNADQLVLLPIYPAGEKPLPGFETQDLLKEVEKSNPNTQLVELEKLPEAIRSQSKSGDVVFCLGAGSITRSCDEILKNLG